MANVERFQNQFIVQRNNIDEALHAVNSNERLLQAEINENPIAVDRRSVEYHGLEKEMVESFEKNFNELRSEFNEFVGKWL